MQIIGITGTTGAGKGTVVEYLQTKGFKHFSVGDFLKEKVLKSKKKVDRTALQDMADKLRRRYGPDYITKKLFALAKKSNQNSIIESIRNPKELEYIKKNGGIMIAVNADIKTRYKRIKKRASEKDFVTFDEFKKQERRESLGKDPNVQNLPVCIKLSDYKINNNGTLSKLHKQIDKIIEKNENTKQEKYIRPSWDDYFLEIMVAASKRGTCDRGRASCVFVKDKQLLVTGYVGSPTGLPHCDDVGHLMKKVIHEDGHITQHCMRTVHAEQNAICQAAKRGVSLDGSTCYVNMTPCRTCAMLLINSGVKRVYALNKYHAGQESEEVFKKAKVKLQFKSKEVMQYKNQKG